MNSPHSPAYVLNQYLQTAIDFTDWSIFDNFLPDKPSQCIVFFDSQNSKQTRNQRTGQTYFRNGIQIMVRCDYYLVGYAFMQKLLNELDAIKLQQVQVEDWLYTIHTIVNVSGVLSMGFDPDDDARRRLFSMNIEMVLEPEFSPT